MMEGDLLKYILSKNNEVLQSMPKYIPGESKAKKAGSRSRLIINFQLC